MSAWFKKKKDEDDLSFGSAQKFDNYQKAGMTSGELYGVRSKNLDVPDTFNMPLPSDSSAPVLPPLPGYEETSDFPPVPQQKAIPTPERYDSYEAVPEPAPRNEYPAPSPYQDNQQYGNEDYQAQSMPAAPLPPSPPRPQPVYQEQPAYQEPSHEEQIEMLTEDLERIAEAIIDRKLQGAEEVISRLQEIQNMASDVENLKNQFNSLNEKFDSLHRAMIGKTEEYNKSINDVNSELAAVGKVFEKLIPEFTKDVRELSGMVDKKLSSSKRGRSKKKD